MFKLWLVFIVGSLLSNSGYQIAENTVPLSVDADTQIEEPLSAVQPEYSLYADLVDAHEPVSQFLIEDINSDGQLETIVVFGTEDTAAYCFRENGADIQLLGRLEGNGYSTGEVKLVKLQRLLGQYIWIRVKNGMNLNGFALYEVKGDALQLFAYSASATGSGHDTIEDMDEDGRFDAYVQSRSSYDVLYYPTYRAFSLLNGSFEHTYTSMDLGSYPTEPSDVIDQYLKLSLLNEAKCIEAVERLENLNKSQQSVKFTDTEVWIEAFVVGTIEFKEAMEAEKATVQVKMNETQLIFNLIQEESQWRILEIIQ